MSLESASESGLPSSSDTELHFCNCVHCPVTNRQVNNGNILPLENQANLQTSTEKKRYLNWKRRYEEIVGKSYLQPSQHKLQQQQQHQQ